MKNSSEYIAKQVFNVNAYYTNKQNETKKLFFKCLKDKKGQEYFEKELSKIWDNIDHRFMDNQITKLKELVHSNNVEEKLNLGRFDDEKHRYTEDWVIDEEYFRLTPESEFQKFENKFKKNVEKQYKNTKTNIKDLDSSEYLRNKLISYDKNINQVITYFNANGNPIRQVQLSSYLSMIHNTNLTRSGWNQTIGDSENLGQNMFIIPYHPFSCPYCVANQNRPLTRRQVENIIGIEAREQQGDILHPNCKCTLSIYWDSSQIQIPRYNYDEIEQQYQLRQKVNGLTLEKSNLLTNQRIAEDIGNMDLADKYREQRNNINRKIRELKQDLPSDLKKQITAIKR